MKPLPPFRQVLRGVCNANINNQATSSSKEGRHYVNPCENTTSGFLSIALVQLCPPSHYKNQQMHKWLSYLQNIQHEGKKQTCTAVEQRK